MNILVDSLPVLAESGASNALDDVVRGTVAVQYARRTNTVHAFCHGVAYYYDVQQGVVHGILAPHVLRYVFDRVDGRRELIGNALEIRSDADSNTLATAIVDRVVRIRNALGLPSQLRSIDGIEYNHLPEIAATIESDSNHRRNPPGLEPDAGDIETVLRNAW